GRGRNRIVFTTLNTALFAPMPKARARMPRMLTAGRRRSMRRANRKSWKTVDIAFDSAGLFVSQRHEWIDARGATRRQETGGQRHRGQQQTDCRKSRAVRRTDV